MQDAMATLRIIAGDGAGSIPSVAASPLCVAMLIGAPARCLGLHSIRGHRHRFALPGHIPSTGCLAGLLSFRQSYKQDGWSSTFLSSHNQADYQSRYLGAKQELGIDALTPASQPPLNSSSVENSHHREVATGSWMTYQRLAAELDYERSPHEVMTHVHELRAKP